MSAPGVQFKLYALFSDDTRASRVGDADVAALHARVSPAQRTSLPRLCPATEWSGSEGDSTFLTAGVVDDDRIGGTLPGRTIPDGPSFPVEFHFGTSMPSRVGASIPLLSKKLESGRERQKMAVCRRISSHKQPVTGLRLGQGLSRSPSYPVEPIGVYTEHRGHPGGPPLQRAPLGSGAIAGGLTVYCGRCFWERPFVFARRR